MNLSPINYQSMSAVTNLNQQKASVNFRGKGLLLSLPNNLAEARKSAQKKIEVIYEQMKCKKEQLKLNPKNEEIAAEIESLKHKIRGIVKDFNMKLNDYYSPKIASDYAQFYLSGPAEVWLDVPQEELSLDVLEKAMKEDEEKSSRKFNLAATTSKLTF